MNQPVQWVSAAQAASMLQVPVQYLRDLEREGAITSHTNSIGIVEYPLKQVTSALLEPEKRSRWHR